MTEKQFIYPPKLKEGSLVRVIAPSFSGVIVSDETRRHAKQHVEEELGLRISFSRHLDEVDEAGSSSIASRVDDLHEAFEDPSVDAVLPIIGGWNSNQLLPHIDWNRIAANPKVFCGFSDISALTTAMTEKTGLITYNGPNYSSFGQKYLDPFTINYFKRALFADGQFTVQSSESWTDDEWFIDQESRTPEENEGIVSIQEGVFEGRVFGGTLSVLNLLQGTDYASTYGEQMLFLEEEGRTQPQGFEAHLESFLQSSQKLNIKIGGLALGRFQRSSNMTTDRLRSIITSKASLEGIPVIANVDFGHTDPRITLAIGGIACLNSQNSRVSLTMKSS